MQLVICLHQFQVKMICELLNQNCCTQSFVLYDSKWSLELDFTHILTNMCCQILTRGFNFCKKHHFEMLCEERPDILSMALVYDKIDTQNAFTAMKMFRYSVQ